MLQFILLTVHQVLWKGNNISYTFTSTPDYTSCEQAAVVSSNSTIVRDTNLQDLGRGRKVRLWVPTSDIFLPGVHLLAHSSALCTRSP